MQQNHEKWSGGILKTMKKIGWFSGTKGLASSIASTGVETSGNLFRKFQDTTSSAIEKTKSKTDQVADATADQAQNAWEETKTVTKNIASKTAQKTNETLKGAEHSANFLGKQELTMNYTIENDWRPNQFFFLFSSKINNKLIIAKESSALAKESEEKVEDVVDAISNKTESTWNRTKLAAFDAGERYECQNNLFYALSK